MSRLCTQINGIWHTAIVVGGLEYYYGGGVNQSRPGSTPFGRPLEVIDLGWVVLLTPCRILALYRLCLTICNTSLCSCSYTQIPKEVRDEFLRDMRKVYTPEAYSLFHNNCNDFTNEFSNFLTGSGIPVRDAHGFLMIV